MEGSAGAHRTPHSARRVLEHSTQTDASHTRDRRPPPFFRLPAAPKVASDPASPPIHQTARGSRNVGRANAHPGGPVQRCALDPSPPRRGAPRAPQHPLPERSRGDSAGGAARPGRRDPRAASRRGGASLPHHPHRPAGARAGAPRAGAVVLSPGQGHPRARTLRASSRRRPAPARRRQRPALPGSDPGAEAVERVLRGRPRPGQQHRRRLGRADHPDLRSAVPARRGGAHHLGGGSVAVDGRSTSIR